MTGFEQMLLDKGYIKYILNCKTMKYELAKGHIISTMTNIDHRYFHKTDENVLRKIEAEESVMKEDFTFEDRKGEICFGLHEAGKPSTLISPRPRIEVKRIKDGKQVIDNGLFVDDGMNAILQHFSYEKIFEAMYDRNIVLKLDLTELEKI